MADPKKPNFDRNTFKKGIMHVESSGGKRTWNPNSSATGIYQFLYDEIKDLPIMQGISREQFNSNRELQEKIMDMAIDNKIKDRPGYYRNAKDLTNDYKNLLGERWNFRPDEVAALTHFLGRGGTRKYFKSLASGRPYKVPGINKTPEQYLQEYNKGIGKERNITKKSENPKIEKIQDNAIEKPKWWKDYAKPSLMNLFEKEYKGDSIGHSYLNKLKNYKNASPEEKKVKDDTTFPEKAIDWLSGYIQQNKNKFEDGGPTDKLRKINPGMKLKMNYKKYQDGGFLTEFNEGGSHETNPFGGIPQGMGDNGLPNTVEEGESRLGDYIFSDRIKITKDIAQKYGLAKDSVGKTLSEYVKEMNDKVKESTTKEDKDTFMEMSQRAMQASEEMRMEKLKKEFDQNEFFLGGFASGAGAGAASSGILSGLNLPGIGTATGALDAIKGFSDGNVAQGIGGVAKSAASLIPGVGQVAGPAIDIITGLFDNKNNDNDDILKGIEQTNANQQLLAHKKWGGPVNKYYNSGFLSDPFLMNSVAKDLSGITVNEAPNLDFKLSTDATDPAITSDLSDIKAPVLANSFAEDKANQYKKDNKPGLFSNLFQDTDWSKVGDKANDIARLAPGIANAYQLFDMDKPDEVGLERMTSKFEPTYTDERKTINEFNNTFNNMSNRIAEASGGSGSKALANLQAAGLSRNKGISNAMFEDIDRNIQQNTIGQQMNMRKDFMNLRQGNLEENLNAANQAAYDNNRSKFISGMAENIGDWALENQRKKYPEGMGLFYDWLGEFFRNKDKVT